MIPVLDWSRFASDPSGFATELGAAARRPGFFLLANHDVSRRVIEETFEAAGALFALPQTEKDAVSIRRSPHNRGYVGDGVEALDRASGVKDRKEAFNIGLDLAADDPRVVANEPFRGVNLWPALPGFHETTLRYFDACLAQGLALMRAVALDLGLPEDRFGRDFRAPMATLRLLSYPADPHAQIGAGAHTDYGALTLLTTDGTPGLQVRPRDGDWIDVPHVPGAFVVNIGDCLQRWTNDLYASTPHRVLPPARPRRSIAFFLDPDPDAVVEALPGTGAPRHAPITGAEHLSERLSATYG